MLIYHPMNAEGFPLVPFSSHPSHLFKRPHKNQASELNVENRDLSSQLEAALETGHRAQRVGEDFAGPRH